MLHDATVYLGLETVVGRKLDDIMWSAEIVKQMKREPDVTPIPAQEIVSEWMWK